MNLGPLRPRRVVLTDIEGTTSSISFVKEILFPYARRTLAGFVRSRAHEPAVRSWLDAARAEAGGALADDTLVAMLERWMDSDRKLTSLKALQGLVWEEGYRTGTYLAHVYRDAAAALRRWRDAGHPLYVYSSGSVHAQKLFFSHTAIGDLSSFFCGHFDTEIGGKREVESYARIGRAIGRAPSDILFLSDVVEELDAAHAAGLDTILVDRRADYPQPRAGSAHRRVEGFDGIDPAGRAATPVPHDRPGVAAGED